MRWRGRRTSRNVEDRRGRSAMVRRGVPIGCGGLLLVLLFVLLGGDPAQLLSLLEGTAPPAADVSPGAAAPPADELGEFASVVLASTEDVWHELFAARGRAYREPTLVLFSGAVRSACGLQSAAVGPFYCPADGKLYLDLSFFAQLERRFGASGDFAQGYVIAHEVGHHVQNLLGVSAEVQRAQRGVGATRANELSVGMELMADCLAGVWGHHARKMLEPGDVEEGMNAAAAIGDDAMQRRAEGRVRPESWTHGSSRQRQEWLRRGLQTGDPDACDTFAR